MPPKLIKIKHGINVLSLFDGMSCGQIALERAGIKVDKYFASEIDKYAIEVTQANYPNTIQLGDITKWREWDDLPEVDLILAGSPCQDLSIALKGAGLKGSKSSLFFVFVEILNHYKPKNFLLENVVPYKKEFKANIDLSVGVTGISINSDRFVGQNRPRVYWTNIKIDELPNRPRWNKQYYRYRSNYFRENKSGVCPCLTANMGMGGHNVPLKSENLKDKLTPVECERLQTIPVNYTNYVSNSRRYKMIGDGWTVDVIVYILKGIR